LRVAEVLSLEKLSSKRICIALVKLLSDVSYRSAAKEAQTRIRSADGLERAANIIEELLESHANKHAVAAW
jgi:UDP:flavonoid glycosyltransferase YjiC (YdhE family)